MPSTRSFYADLPLLADLALALEPSVLAPLPEDWDLHLADVVDSTGAIATGMYRAVNLAAVLSLVAARNAAATMVPFSFGGDGMVLAAPREDRQAIRGALAGVARRVSGEFGLDLRVGTIPVLELGRRGAGIHLGKIELAPWAHQATFAGDGVALAERLLKSEEGFQVPATEAIEPDFSGFECRWDAVRPEAGEVLALLVEAPDPDLLRLVIHEVEARFGPAARRNPVLSSRLHLSWSWSQAVREARLVGSSPLRVWCSTQLGRFLMRFGIRQGDWHWARYREDLQRACDFQKLEGSLRMVLACGSDVREKFLEWLSEREVRGLRWGAHVSTGALLTCAVRDYGSDHIHFVDGSEGGYALAALDLKRRFPELHFGRKETPSAA